MSLALKISSYSLFSLSHYRNYSSSSFKCCSSITFSNLPRTQGRANAKVLKWVQRSISSFALPGKLNSVSIVDSSGDARVSASVPQVGGSKHHNRTLSQAVAWKPRSYGTTTNAANASEVHAKKAHATSSKVDDAVLSKFFGGDLLESFSIDNSTYSQSQIRATFYPKFENEKSDREVRSRMIEMVSNGLATMEVSLKHSGSLFMYAGPKGGAYAKNSFGNIYTAVGVFVLGRTFREAWGSQANKKQAEFNEFLERNRMCIAMELVTAVLGDHGQRPLEDYVVVTAVTELGNGKPKFYSSPEIIAFCRKWRLPTNHMWLFSTRKSVTSFFAAFDALCEEGTATTVCQTLDEIADVSVPGSKDHIKVQGEILEGLVARVVNHESTKQIEQVLQDFPLPPGDAAGMDLGPSLRDICAANRSDEKQQIKALLHSVGTSFCPNYLDWFGTEGFEPHSRNAGRSVVSKFLQAHPADFSTKKLQEMIRLMQQKRFPASFKCYYNYQQMNCVSSDNLHFKMAIHVFTDSAFRRYQKELKDKPELWPLYRGFFVDLNLYKSDKEKTADISKSEQDIKSYDNDNGMLVKDGLADEDANMMVKLKLLTYKIRTFLIRNGLSVLFKEGPAAYKEYYQRQMEIWKTSPAKRREMSKMLDEWAVYVRRKYGNKMLSSSVYLSEAEPFLEQYAKRSPQNQALIGCAGNLVRVEDFSAIVDDGRDEEEGLASVRGAEVSPSKVGKDSVTKDQGLVVFFPGIPGCAKSALCKEILKAQGGLGDDRPVHSLMGDLIKGKYWQKIAAERRKKPYSIMLADKNAPNEDVWRQIEDMCRGTKTSAVPVIPDSEGTETNPFSLDALAVFIYRVVQRINHPGKLDRSSPSAGFVLLMFYHLYEGKSRNTFEAELNERFGTIVKMPLLKSERSPLPQSVKSILEEGISLYKLHTDKHGRLESTKGTYAKEWTQWEKNLRETLSKNAEYLKAIQVPFEYAVQQVLEQLKTIASGEYVSQVVEKRRVGPIVYAAVNLPAADIHQLLHKVAERDPKIQAFFEERNIKDSLTKAHVTLAHKRSHGVATVASYSSLVDAEVPVNMRALVFTERMAALEADPGSVSGEKVTSKNQWPHVTLWTDKGVAAKDANTLQQLFLEGKATRVEIDPPITVSGVLQFF